MPCVVILVKERCQMIRTYSELLTLETFEDRYHYLSLKGIVGETTFGSERHHNQKFYTSREWRSIRDEVIARDLGCDLALSGHDIFDRPIIHHMNPMVARDIIHGNSDILEPEYLITTTHRTHNAIHYGDATLLLKPLVDRKPGDTNLWRN